MTTIVDRLRMRLVPPLGHAYIRALHRTMRLTYENRGVLARVRSESGPYILVFWHSRFVMMPYVYPGNRLAVLSSSHLDSRMLGKVLERFGLTNVWSAGHPGTFLGLRPLLHKTKQGYDVGWTPDGPLGPRRIVRPGVVAIARLSGLPLIPVAFSARPAVRLRSWDRTLVPYPFARGVFVYGEPIRVGPDPRGEDQECLRLAVQAELDRLTDQADRRVGLSIEGPSSKAASLRE